jgi:hypothetical protein
MLALPSYRGRGRTAAASPLPLLPTLGGMPIYNPSTVQQPTGVGPGGFVGFGNDMMFPDRSRPQDSAPPQTLASVPMPGGQGVTPRYMTTAGPTPATQPTMFVPSMPVAPPPTGPTGGTAGPMIGNDVLIPGGGGSAAPTGPAMPKRRANADPRYAHIQASGPNVPAGEKYVPSSGSDLFWEPGQGQPAAQQGQAQTPRMPQISAGLGAVPNLAGRGNSPLAPPAGNLTNAGGYAHMPFGSGQDANRAMNGGPTIFDVGGNSLHNYGTPDAMFAYNQQQALSAGQLGNRFNQNSRAPAAGTMPVAGGGGGPGGAFADAMNSANAANENRYQDINSGYTAWRRRVNDLLSGLGNQQRADTNEMYDNRAGEMTQSTISRGLTNSTVLDNLLQGNTRERSSAMARLAEALARERMAQEGGAFKDQVDFMERKTEKGPDASLVASLMERFGAGGGGGGGGMAMPVTVDMSGGGGGYGMGAGMGAYTPAWNYLGARGNIQPKGGRSNSYNRRQAMWNKANEDFLRRFLETGSYT